MSAELDLLEGFGAYLTEQGVALYSDAGASYATTELPVVTFGPLPTTPDRVIALTVYSSVDDPLQPLSTFRVQFYVRGVPGDSLDAALIAETVFGAIQSMHGVTFGGVNVSDCRRFSFIPQGIDENNRAERADNYTVVTAMPGTTWRPKVAP